MSEAQAFSDICELQQCQLCLKKNMKIPAAIYCVECSEYQCEKCAQGHDNYTYMSNHTSVSVLEGQNYVSSVDGDDEEITRFMCKKHNLKFEFYCQQDYEFLCSKCAIISHKKCENIHDIDSMDGHGGCEKMKNELVAVIDSTNKVMELLEEADTRLSDGISTLSDKLKDMKARMIKKFEDFSKSVLAKASSSSTTTKNDLAKKKAKCYTTIKSLKKPLQSIECIMNTGTPAEKFITERSLKNEVQKAVKDAIGLEKDIPSVDISCVFTEQFHNFKSELLSFLESETLDISFHIPAPSTLQLVKSVKLQQLQDDVDEPLYSGLDFLPDGRVVVADNMNMKFLVYDINLNIKSSYKLSYPPHSVTAISNEEVVVTSATKYSLDFLNVSKTNDITLNRTCEMNVVYESISMMNDDSFLVGTIDHIKPFRIVSMSGDESDVGINLPDKKYPVGTSFCTYIRGREKVVHCDKDGNFIFIYDIKSSERVEVKHQSIKSPCGVAVGPYDHIFVCSMRTNCLVEITSRGRVLSSHHVDMLGPRFVAISKDSKYLAVSNASKAFRILSLYTIL